MFTRSRIHRTTTCALALISALTFAACTDEPPVTSPAAARRLSAPTSKASHNIYVSGAELDLLAVEVSGGELKQPLLYNLRLGAKENSGFLAMPAGKGYGAEVRGYDKNGTLTHVSKLELESVEVGENKRLELSLDPVEKGEVATISMDLVGEEPSKDAAQIVIKQSAVDGESMTLTAIVLDAYGRELKVDPNEVHWALLDPSTGRLDPAMSDEMAMAKYIAYERSVYWLTIIAEYRNIRKDWLDQFKVDEWVDVSAGSEVTCGLKASGKLYCWGINSRNELASSKDSACGGFDCSSAPLLVEGGKLFEAVSVGKMHVCALEKGTAIPNCWGDNMFGAAGQPSSVSNVATPTTVSGNPGPFKSISVGWNHTCGVTSGGLAMCWGAASSGRLGTGGSTNQSSPVQVSPPLGGAQQTYARVSAGMLHSCGITTSSRIFCWGTLGGSGFSVPTEVALQGNAGWSTLSEGGLGMHVCATNSASVAFCWGDDAAGQLGNNVSGSGQRFATPQLVKGGLAAFSPALVSTATGELHSCGLSATGAAFCWGTAFNGQLGNGSQVQANTPVGVSGGLTFTKISAGTDHTCALDSSHDIYCWGTNTWGQLGIGSRSAMLAFGSRIGVATPTKIVAPVP